jgi:potassium uptake Trk family protein
MARHNIRNFKYARTTWCTDTLISGLNTVNLSTLNTFQQCMLFVLIIMGSAVFVSAFVVYVRKRAFEKRFTHVNELRRRRAERRGPGSLVRRLSRSATRSIHHDVAPIENTISKIPDDNAVLDSPLTESDVNIPIHISFGPNVHFHTDKPSATRDPHTLSVAQVGASSHTNTGKDPVLTKDEANLQQGTLESVEKPAPFSSSSFISRNSSFHNLTEEERVKLGGYEYRAIRLLSWLVPVYFALFHLFGCLGVGAYVAINRPSTALKNGLNPWWMGSFNAVSAFNNSGLSLLDANMVAFQTSVYMLMTMGLLILAGNTCYPIFLRLIVWTFLKALPKHESWDDLRKTLQFLLNHPRRCYTNLFPARHTWWLLACVVCLNGIDWAAFEVLNIGNDAITSLPAGIEVLDGLFQALAVRSGGFYVVLIPSVRISLQTLYVIMMYISPYPVLITVRNSNVYEERSLGIYADHDTGQGAEHTTSYFVREQLRAQLAHDLWYVVLAVFLISIIEGGHFAQDPAVYSIFNIVFETVSAYGCVGISVGLPDEAYSFSGGLHTLSKLVLCAVMIRGRHRGLPVAIDRAVLLPGEELDEAEEEDGELRMERTISRGRSV